MVANQRFASIDSFVLDSGIELTSATIAYKTWGRLNENRDNCLVICHALSGSSDVEDWWGPLLGPGKAFDVARYFIFCGNVLGSPYGSSSPLGIDPQKGTIYGPEFPQTTIRDDVR
jgi:homoserine O-acetyltransferase